MKIQLFLENQEVELNDKVSFPLNKSFDNLWNPTDIIIEYSKSINIPATAANNRLMANAYRIDRQFIINEDSPNIGLYLDPMKRIPMKLIYNNSILLDGYAKYSSATVGNKGTYYTFNLYGALGDIFQKLMDCVVDANKLTDDQKAESDGGAKYVIECPWEPRIINKDLVYDSWTTPVQNFDYLYTSTNNIGFAPAYRGAYDNFESNSIVGGDPWHPPVVGTYEPQSVETILKSSWKTILTDEEGYSEAAAAARVDAIDFNTILPNGLTEHIMKQFRSYEQKPYIYFFALMRLFQNKCQELTGYTINLDVNWFNIHNPYWSKLCYMFDYLSTKGNTLSTALPFTGYTKRTYNGNYYSTASYTITDSEVLSKGDITLNPFTICAENKYAYNNTNEYKEIRLGSLTELLMDVTVTTGGTTMTYKYWGATRNPADIPENDVKPSPPSGYKDFILLSDESRYDVDEGKIIGKTYMTIPSIKIQHTPGDDISITYKFSVHTYRPASFLGPMGWNLFINGSSKKDIVPSVNNEDFHVIFPNVEYVANWRNSTTCELKNLYTKDEPLFNVILQYTKMFGLIWKPDYRKKTIDIMTRSTYFKDYKVVDWTDKIDKNNGFTIEPVSFSAKYVTFNYEDVDGFRYSGYRNKYGVNYGEKKLKTKYNFDTKEDKLFKHKIHPSSISCKSFPTYGELQYWNTINKLELVPSEVDFIDCENEDEKSAITLNNWYFRLPNITTENAYTICDASQEEIDNNSYCWRYDTLGEPFAVRIWSLPQFSPVTQSEINNLNVGCLFNCPNEDYSRNRQMSAALGNYVYDICWSDFINERYNGNNKKLTAYVKLTPAEFEDFNFKQFVTIDNQMFVVNKIIDFNIDSELTKCEFIQVTNINGYIKQKVEFTPYIIQESELYISPKYIKEANAYIGSASITIKGYPIVNTIDDFDYWITPVRTESGAISEVIIDDAESDNTGVTYYLSYYSDNIASEQYMAHFRFMGTEYTIPIYILEN